MRIYEWMLLSIRLEIEFWDVGHYLFILGDDLERSPTRGRNVLKLYGVIPNRETEKNCSDCGNVLRTSIDRIRHVGFRYESSNHERRRRFSPSANTFLGNVRTNERMSEYRVIFIIYQKCQ